MKQKRIFARKRILTAERVVAYTLLGAIVLLGAVVLAAVAERLVPASFYSGNETVASLAIETHFHGLSVDAKDPSRLYVATHRGLFVVGAAGRAQQISENRDDFMAFTPHPLEPALLYASGHPSGGGNTGFIASDDGGRSWRKLSDGARGPVDFHQLDISKADPKTLYGIYGDIQKSTNGGQNWILVGPPPEGLIDLAASSRPDTLYAATDQGLLRSTDDGKNWRPAYTTSQGATMVEVTDSGEIYAFVVGIGLVHAEEQDLTWEVAYRDFGSQFVVYLAVAPTDNRRLYAVTFNPSDRSQSLITSTDGGESWTPLGKG